MEGLVALNCIFALLLSAAGAFAFTQLNTRSKEVNRDLNNQITVLKKHIRQLQTEVKRLYLLQSNAQQRPISPELSTSAELESVETKLPETVLSETILPEETMAEAVDLPATDEPLVAVMAELSDDEERQATSVIPTPKQVLADSLPLQEEMIDEMRAEDAFFDDELSAKTIPTKDSPLQPLYNWFAGTHIMVQIGMVILFFGVSFLIKYAVDQGWVSIQVRLIGAALLGLSLAFVGWRLRYKARTYGLALQGGGLGIIYLTTYGAFRFYNLLPDTFAFAIFLLLGVICATLAILNNSRILAFLAMLGAFPAPFLASNGEGSHVTLFSYYTLLNIGILAMAWFKSWRILNWVGFFFTFTIGAAWGMDAYRPDLFSTTEPFLILFFFFYIAITILFTARQSQPEPWTIRRNALDSILLFGTPFVTFGLQAPMVADYEYGLAWSALAIGLVYLLLSLFFMVRKVRSCRPLVEPFLFLGLFFLAMSIPFAFGAYMTAALWVVKGATSVWLGMRRQKIWHQVWGVLVQIGASIAFATGLEEDVVAMGPYLNSTYVTTVIISLSGLFSAYILSRNNAHVQSHRLYQFSLMAWGLLWWFGGGIQQVFEIVEWPYLSTTLLVFIALSALVGEWLGKRLSWFSLRFPALIMLVPFVLLAMTQLIEVAYYPATSGYIVHHFQAGGWYAWPLALVAHYWTLYRHRAGKYLSLHHIGGLWLTVFIITLWVAWYLYEWGVDSTWIIAAVVAIPLLITLVISQFGRRLPWPISAKYATYNMAGLAPLLLLSLIWLFLIHVGNPSRIPSLPYIPLLNPIGGVHILLLATLFGWIYRAKQAQHIPSDMASLLYWVWSILTFFVVNLAVARAVHHATGIPFTFDPLFYAALLQSIYAIFWGVLSLILMVTAHRRGLQPIWIAGACVLALTVLKLFAIDLVNANTVARIVSFIGVGLLIIIIAYFAPVPPKDGGLEEMAEGEAIESKEG